MIQQLKDPHQSAAVCRAIRDWEEAAERVRETNRRCEGRDDDALDQTLNLEVGRLIEAERFLIRAILATGPEAGQSLAERPERRVWPRRGVVFAGRLYLVSVVDEDIVGPRGLCDEMRVLVTPPASILEVASVPEPSPGDWFRAVMSADPRTVRGTSGGGL